MERNKTTRNSKTHYYIKPRKEVIGDDFPVLPSEPHAHDLCMTHVPHYTGGGVTVRWWGNHESCTPQADFSNLNIAYTKPEIKIFTKQDKGSIVFFFLVSPNKMSADLFSVWPVHSWKKNLSKTSVEGGKTE